MHGNRLTKTLNGVTENYTYDNGDKLLTAGSKSYEYDLAGRTKKVTNLLSVTNLTYDDEDRLLTVVGPGISQSYTYNGADTRVSKTHNGSLTSYQRDGVGVTAPLISDSGAVYTPGVSEKRGGVSTFLHGGMKDLGAQSDTSQNLTATRQYDAYGMVVASTGTWKGPFGYSGSAGYQEDESGLQLLGHRYYDASTGRFLTRDPIQDGRNWYVYCDNSPIDFMDADGLTPKGHHIVPREIFKDGRVSAEAAEVFESFTTGDIPGGHGFGEGHVDYNKACKEEFATYCKEKGIDPKKMTKSQAKAFANRILNSKDARIAGFLAKIYGKIGKAAPKIISASTKKIATKLAKKIGKAALKKVPIIGWILLGETLINQGAGAAVNDFLWPFSELWGGGG